MAISKKYTQERVGKFFPRIAKKCVYFVLIINYRRTSKISLISFKNGGGGVKFIIATIAFSLEIMAVP
jgi:hypothetical protein